MAQVLQAQWHPLEWEVAEVAIISRQVGDLQCVVTECHHSSDARLSAAMVQVHMCCPLITLMGRFTDIKSMTVPRQHQQRHTYSPPKA
jgi:hypothetical protein